MNPTKLVKRLTRVAALAATLAASSAAQAAGTLTVAYNQWAGFAAVFVAQKQGYFAEEGVDVKLQSFAGPGDSLPPLVAGHIDVSLTTPDNVILLNNTADADIVAVYMIDASEGADAIIGKAEIAGPADLKGKTVAVTVGEVNHLLLLKAMESAGLAESDVNMVDMSPDDAGGAFVAGNVDAAVTWEPWVSKALESGGRVVFSSKDAPNLLLDVVAVPRKLLDEKPEAVAALVRGIDRGLQFMKANPEAAYAMAGEWLDVPGPDVGAMLDGVKLYTREDNTGLLGTAEAPGTLVDSLRAISAFLLARGKIGSEKDVAAMVDPRLVAP